MENQPSEDVVPIEKLVGMIECPVLVMLVFQVSAFPCWKLTVLRPFQRKPGLLGERLGSESRLQDETLSCGFRAGLEQEGLPY